MSEKRIYWFLLLLISLQMANSIGKFVNAYYGNILFLVGLVFLQILWAVRIKIAKWIYFSFTILMLGLSYLLYYFVWN